MGQSTSRYKWATGPAKRGRPGHGDSQERMEGGADQLQGFRRQSELRHDVRRASGPVLGWRRGSPGRPPDRPDERSAAWLRLRRVHDRRAGDGGDPEVRQLRAGWTPSSRQRGDGRASWTRRRVRWGTGFREPAAAQQASTPTEGQPPQRPRPQAQYLVGVARRPPGRRADVTRPAHLHLPPGRARRDDPRNK